MPLHDITAGATTVSAQLTATMFNTPSHQRGLQRLQSRSYEVMLCSMFDLLTHGWSYQLLSPDEVLPLLPLLPELDEEVEEAAAPLLPPWSELLR
mmetsp:Transcript_21896/g.37428  ORF Transcript_21896/g.37428 Transcript_21896/m.37428 type:complete len:95 (+) Transcript_21896:93-377(+)